MRQRKGFTLIELLVVISIIALLIGILLPALGAARRTARQLQANTNWRGIHQSMVVFAQNNKTGGAEGFFPGMNAQGAILDNNTQTDDLNVHLADRYNNTEWPAASGNHPTIRFGIGIEENAFSPDILINPLETGDPSVIQVDGTTGNMQYDEFDDDAFYSYAVLDLDSSTRRQEWSETINSRAVVGGDRITDGSVSPPGDKASHTSSDDNSDWRGTVGWNDNRVETSNTTVHETRYGFQRTTHDNLFDSDQGPALLIHPDGVTNPGWSSVDTDPS